MDASEVENYSDLQQLFHANTSNKWYLSWLPFSSNKPVNIKLELL